MRQLDSYVSLEWNFDQDGVVVGDIVVGDIVVVVVVVVGGVVVDIVVGVGRGDCCYAWLVHLFVFSTS